MMIGVVGMEEEEEGMTMRFPTLATIVVVDVAVVEVVVEGITIVTMMRGITMVDVDISQIIVPIVDTMKSTQVIDTIIERRMNGNLCSMWTREEKKERLSQEVGGRGHLKKMGGASPLFFIYLQIKSIPFI